VQERGKVRGRQIHLLPESLSDLTSPRDDLKRLSEVINHEAKLSPSTSIHLSIHRWVSPSLLVSYLPLILLSSLCYRFDNAPCVSFDRNLNQSKERNLFIRSNKDCNHPRINTGQTWRQRREGQYQTEVVSCGDIQVSFRSFLENAFCSTPILICIHHSPSILSHILRFWIDSLVLF